MTRTAFQSALEDIFGLSAGSLKDEDGRHNLSGWTSLADVEILAVVLDELGMEPDSDLIEVERVGDLMGALESRGAFQA